ncbi:conserved Plasmodium protein, unknown function [Plasmodium gallinaceum]|uniref:RAP domain-containing protein n=1 Tax=Plasmodium gallinaceum TaxID=5849 RepID=A0A1J1GUF1_PLAGA|nr:conserved Plasmodium protein, unknown function [Plasmodium gallinaceum]CRG95929.1 conserved Plasmodium protein, unknown function [Plasmodium gallinaceum]
MNSMNYKNLFYNNIFNLKKNNRFLLINNKFFVNVKNLKYNDRLRKKYDFFYSIKRGFSILTCDEIDEMCNKKCIKNKIVHKSRVMPKNISYNKKDRDMYNDKIFDLLIELKNKRNRDIVKLKKIITYVFKNITYYNLKDITRILYCIYFFSIILKKEDIYRLIERLKLLTFNNKEDSLDELTLNLLRIRIPRENIDEKLIYILNNFLNNLLLKILSYNNFNDYFIKEIQLIYLHDFSSWINKKYLNISVKTFLQSYRNYLVNQNKNLDYLFINEVINILTDLNCIINNLVMYNYTIPIYIKNFNLIIECISEKNTFLDSLLITPYFLQRYNLFKKLNYKVLLLYKQLLPQNQEEKIAFIKNSIYDIIK